MSEQAQTPTLWQRFTSGVKNFTSGALGYIPRGIVLTAVVFAAAALVETYSGGSISLGLLKCDNQMLLGRFLGQLALGSIVSGVIYASAKPCEPCEQKHNGEVSGALISAREAQLGEYMAKTVTDHATSAAVEAVAPGGGLPAQLLGGAAKAAVSNVR